MTKLPREKEEMQDSMESNSAPCVVEGMFLQDLLSMPMLCMWPVGTADKFGVSDLLLASLIGI